MNTNINELIKKLPDYEDFMKLARTIADLSEEKTRLEISIKAREADIVMEVTTNPSYFVSGKVPAMSFVEATYRYKGLTGELIPMRNNLASIVALLDEKKEQMEVYRSMLDIWRTLSANERKANL